MSTKLFVGNLPFDTLDADLQAHFERAGSVATVNIMRERETGRPRGFAFVEMESGQDAQAAIDQLHEQPFGGRRLIVNEARPMAPRAAGGGNNGGGYGRSRREPRW
jgi:RNA recognition motif-containing protein